jgi:hypothetical protein
MGALVTNIELKKNCIPDEKIPSPGKKRADNT